MQTQIHPPRCDPSGPDLFYAGDHPDTGGYGLEGLSQGDEGLGAEVGHFLAFNVHHLVPRLQTCQVGTAALHHRQNVAGPRTPQTEAKLLRPVLVGGWKCQVWVVGQRTGEEKGRKRGKDMDKKRREVWRV